MNTATNILRFALLTSIVIATALAAFNGVRAAEPDHGKTVLNRIPQLKTFIDAKEKQARKDLQATEEKVPAEVWAYFEAARTGDWNKANKLYKSLCYRGEEAEQSNTNLACGNTARPLVLEVELVLEAFATSNPKYSEAFGRGIVESIPRGAIFFGGTDPGRGLPTAFSKSHAEGDPFFTITQNAFADSAYLAYLRRMYGSKIFVPSSEDSQKAFADYMADAQRRLDHDTKYPNEPKQLRPGEDVRMVNNQVRVSGQVAVMRINGMLAKVIFDKNPQREFYIEESFPLDWMYPHLEPHGLILKINREPLAKISEEALRRDHEFWSKQVGKMLGDWLTDETPVQQVCAFVEKVYLEKNLQEFRGDRVFLDDEYARKAFSKLRSSIGGLYFWRVQHLESKEARVLKEANFAFRQAFALCPTSPEALYRYVNLLIAQGRMEEALALAETACKLEPQNGQTESLRQELQRIQKDRK